MCPESQQDLLLGNPQPMALPEQVEFQKGLSGELDKPLEFEHSVIPGDLSLALVWLFVLISKCSNKLLHLWDWGLWISSALTRSYPWVGGKNTEKEKKWDKKPPAKSLNGYVCLYWWRLYPSKGQLVGHWQAFQMIVVIVWHVYAWFFFLFWKGLSYCFHAILISSSLSSNSEYLRISF